MSIVADHYTFVVGVDTHARTHTYAILTGGGRLVDQQEFPTQPAGVSRALDWIGRRTAGDISGTLLSVEGTGSYGAQLTATAAEHGYRVVEAPFPTRHGQGKTDALDAQRAARNVLPVERDRLRDHRRHDGQRDVLQALTVARDHLQTHRTATINALTAHLRVHEAPTHARPSPRPRSAPSPRGAPATRIPSPQPCGRSRSTTPATSQPWTRNSPPTTPPSTSSPPAKPPNCAPSPALGPSPQP